MFGQRGDIMKLLSALPFLALALAAPEASEGPTEKREAAPSHHAPYPPAPYDPYQQPAPYGPPPYIEVPETQHHYGHHPSHNCTVQDEVLTAEICTPTYSPACGPMPVKGTRLGEREECVTVTRTVCSQGQAVEQAEICLVEYTEKKQAVDATTVEVKFVKQCEKQMVTVCQPQPSYGPSYHTVQHCKEVGQETCYNLPSLEPRLVQVEISLPQPQQRCENRPVVLPTVQCEDVTEKRCVMLPTVEAVETEATACVPVVAQPKCDKVELVLPKQVCRELLYGFAEKPVQQQYQEHPPPPPPQHHIPYNANTRKIKYLNKPVQHSTERTPAPHSRDPAPHSRAPALHGPVQEIPEGYAGPLLENEVA